MMDSNCEHEGAVTQALYGINPLGTRNDVLAAYSGV